jgi:hypothetical protein
MCLCGVGTDVVVAMGMTDALCVRLRDEWRAMRWCFGLLPMCLLLGFLRLSFTYSLFLDIHLRIS